MFTKKDLPTPIMSSINIPVAVSWKEIQKRASAFAIGKKFGKGQFDVTVKDIVIWEDNGFLKIQVETSGTYDGMIRIQAIPAFDPSINKFIFRDLKLDMAADGFFQRGLVFLFKGFVEKQLENVLDKSLDEPIENLTAQVNKAIENFKPMPNLSLDGAVDKFKLIDFNYNEKGIILQMAATGQMGVRIN